MDKIPKPTPRIPIWMTAIIISFVSIVFLVYVPFQISLLPEDEVRKVYYVDNISDAHRKIIQRFNELHKGKIEVVPIDLPFNYFTTNDRKEILTRSLRSRSEGVDIFAVDIIWIPRFAKWGYPMNIEMDEARLQNVSPMALQVCYYNDNLVAFPMFLDLGVLYYRKDLIRALPDGGAIEQRIQESITWDELVALGRRFHNSGHPVYVFGGGSYEGMLCCFQEMLTNKESDEIYYQEPLTLNTPPAARALQQMVDLIYRHNVSPSIVTRLDDNSSYEYAKANNALFFRGWLGGHEVDNTLPGDSSTASLMEIAPVPHFAGHAASGVFGGWSLMISKFSDRKEEAMKFIDFMFEKENQQILYEDGGYLPVNTAVYRDSVFLGRHKELRQIQRLLAMGRHRPLLEHYTRYSEVMARCFNKALKNEISVPEALDMATEQIRLEKSNARQVEAALP